MKIKNKTFSENKVINILMGILIYIGIFAIVGAIDFALFTFGYWIITLILMTFFGFVLPFSWWYSFGAGLIYIIINIIIFLPQNVGNNLTSS